MPGDQPNVHLVYGLAVFDLSRLECALRVGTPRGSAHQDDGSFRVLLGQDSEADARDGDLGPGPQAMKLECPLVRFCLVPCLAISRRFPRSLRQARVRLLAGPANWSFLPGAAQATPASASAVVTLTAVNPSLFQVRMCLAP